MSIVVGFGTDTRGEDGVRFGAELARGTGEPLALVCVVPTAFAGRPASTYIDTGDERDEALHSVARDALESARAALPDDIAAQVVTRVGRSIPKILTEEGADRDAKVLVLGSAASGRLGRIGLGSTTDRLVHSSALPVALTPRGYAPNSDRVRRLVFAVGIDDAGVRLADSVARLARWLGVPIALVTFTVRPARGSGFDAIFDQGTYAQWDEEARAAHASIGEAVAGLAANGDSTGAGPAGGGPAGGGGVAVASDPDAGMVTSSHLAAGESWAEALEVFDWHDGDALVVGSSDSVWSGVFLGSTATHILRHAPVPMFILPARKK